jgi:hypothetical protein
MVPRRPFGTLSPIFFWHKMIPQLQAYKIEYLFFLDSFIPKRGRAEKHSAFRRMDS